MSKLVRVLDLGDLHTGHEVGLWPEEGMPMPDGREIALNEGQKHLLKCWNHLYRYARDEIKPDILTVHGDLVDGEQRKSYGTEASTTIIAAQIKAARHLLEPFVGLVKEVYILRGTPYHDGARGLIVEAIGESLGAIGPTSGWHSWSLLDLDVQGVIINIQHAISIATGFYRATPLDREGIWSALAGKEGKVPKADAVLRGHAHVYVHVEHPSKHILISPCWQLQTEYMRRHSAYRMIPDVGAVVLELDPKAKARGEDPVTVRKVLYPLPEVIPHLSHASRVEESDGAETSPYV